MDSSKLPQTFWLGAALVFVMLGLAYLMSFAVAEKTHVLPPLGNIVDFTLTNQDGRTVNLSDLTNHVWVADIIFTRCAGPCPRMTRQMKSVQDRLSPADKARLVTLTTDPDFDSPAILKKYGAQYGADLNRWTFLTGRKSEIGMLAANSLKLSATPIKPEDQKDSADLFIHTTVFVVVDKHARLRGVFETGGEGVDWTNVVRPGLLAAIRKLEREP